MRAVFRHELSSYFTGVTGYVFSAFLLLFTGIYTMVYNLQSASVHFEYVLGSMSFVFLIIVPILTMRVLAEERRQKTDQLLYSLPLTMTQVVLGKFTAMLVVFAVPMAVICLYPVVLSAYGNVYLPAAYGAIVGFFFLGMALLAIGMYISSVTESQAVAAGLCFVVMLMNYFLSDLAGFASAHGLFVPRGAGGDGADRLRHRVSDDEKWLCVPESGGSAGSGTHRGLSLGFQPVRGAVPADHLPAEPVCPVLYHRQRRVRRDRHCVLPVGDGIFPVFKRAVSGEAEVE